ncbi:TIGR02099 family protein [Aliidiomarina iranensis]|uniref:TIGR02099 family protein n=1 Tax=Aliidiomarina iranensis TaxID=1434071 RepID=A0A432W2L8_9GAMM|nr:YhdP family protein [Aliidiomarina iranensis]RUO23477.1 TIGR02099 family protein [Aliidiomarina iranensis]
MNVRSTLSFVIRKLWLTAAVILVGLAVLLSIVRFSLPYLDYYRTDIEQQLSERFNQEVQIGSLSATWNGIGPALVLEDLELVVNEGAEARVAIGTLAVGIDFWNSLLQRQVLLNHFSLTGMELDVYYQGSNGESNVLAELQEPLERLLFQQLERFQLHDSLVRLHIGEQEPRAIEIEQLQWRRDALLKQATGLFRIPDITSNSLDFVLDVYGEAFAEVSGSLYVEAQQLDVSPWLQEITQTSSVERAEFNLQAWLDFENGQFGEGQVRFAENTLAWRRGDELHQLITTPTVWTLFPEPGGWILNSNPMVARIDEQEWRLEQVTWQYREGEHLWNLNDIELIDFGPVWNLFGAPGIALGDWADGLQLQGWLDSVQIRLDADRDWQLYGRGSDIRWQPHRGIPGINGLQMEVWSTLSEGRFELQGDSVSLSSPATYNDAKVLNEVMVSGGWLQDQGHWELDVEEALFSLPGADISQQMRFTGAPNEPVEVDWLINGGTSGMAVLDVVSLLPLQLGERLGNYLNNSLLDGEVDSLSMVWRGPVGRFPYTENEGVLQAHALINDMDYRFQPNWPAVMGTRAELTFAGNELAINARGGQLLDIPLTEVDATISNLSGGERHLHIAADVAAEGGQLQELFLQSPLANSVGAALERVQPNGALTGAFTLDIPLVGQRPQVKAQGRVNLVEQDIYIQPVNLWLRDIDGYLTFDNADINFVAEGASLFALPVQVELTGGLAESNESGQRDYQIAAKVDANWQAPAIHEEHANIPLIQQLQGEFAWNADFNLNLLAGGAGYNYQWLMDADLAATDLLLPKPFAKTAGEARNLTVEVTGNQERLRANASSPEVFALRGDMRIGSGAFQALELQIGDSPYTVGARPENGFRIMAGLAEAELGDWLPIIVSLGRAIPAPAEVVASANLSLDAVGLDDVSDNLGEVAASAGAEPTKASPVPPLSRVDAQVSSLQWFGQDFRNTEIEGRSSGDGWLLDVDAENGRARIDWSTIGSGQLTVAADFLELNRPPEVNSEERVIADRSWLNSMPPIIFTCRICRYQGRELGQVALRLEPANGEQQVRQFEIRKGSTVLQASGGWSGEGEAMQTALQGTFVSNNVGSYLSELGFNSVVRDSSADFRFDLGWDGALQDWNKETLRGEVNWALGAGYLRDVSDGGARLLSILSLESVLRKFALDFRDIFARGMFYSSFGGTLTLENGVIRTENTRMNGSAGDMTVSGSTNLVDEQLNYRLSYVPKVTSSLPVLLAFMVNPPSGIAALVLDRMLHDAEVISRLEYEVTGTMQDPIVTEVQRDSTEVELPEMAEDVLPPELPANTEAQREQGGATRDPESNNQGGGNE